MKYSLDPVNKFIYTTDDNNDFHSYNKCPAVIYFNTKKAIFMTHGKIDGVMRIHSAIMDYVEHLNGYSKYLGESNYLSKSFNGSVPENWKEILDLQSFGSSDTDTNTNKFESSIEKLIKPFLEPFGQSDVSAVDDNTKKKCRNSSNPYHICSNYCKKHLKRETEL